jgi:predicted enzyme related to lactoylglutathione lyase
MPELRLVRNTDRYDDAVAFYRDVLAWPVVRSWTEGGRGCLMGYSDTAVVELLEVDGAEPVTGVFVSIEVHDVDAVARRLADGGVPITQPIADQPWGHRSIGVTDPTGLPVVLFQVR